MSTVPIPATKPNVSSGGGFFDTIKSTLTGTFNAGLDILATQLENKQAIEMLEAQAQIERQATNTNITGNPQGVASNLQLPSLASMSPLTLALLAVAGVLIIKG